MDKIIDVKELTTNFYTNEGVVKAVNKLSYHINKGECVGLVGESGCGKSVSALSLLRLVPSPPGWRSAPVRRWILNFSEPGAEHVRPPIARAEDGRLTLCFSLSLLSNRRQHILEYIRLLFDNLNQSFE